MKKYEVNLGMILNNMLPSLQLHGSHAFPQSGIDPQLVFPHHGPCSQLEFPSLSWMCHNQSRKTQALNNISIGEH